MTLRGAPSPEVTGLICRVPSLRVSRSPCKYACRPPVSVCGTGTVNLPRGFSCRYGLMRIGVALRRSLSIHPHLWHPRICLWVQATVLDVHGQQDAHTSPPGPPIGHNDARWYGTINPLSIAYAHVSLGLGPTNPERIDLAQETLDFRCVGFSPTIRYSCHHSHFHALQPSLRSTFTAHGTLPYHYSLRCNPKLRCLA